MTTARQSGDAMKLIVAVIQGHDSSVVLGTLVERGFHATLVDGQSGFPRERNATLFVGVQEPYVAEVMRLIQAACQTGNRMANPVMPLAEPVDVFVNEPVAVAIGGVTLLVFDVARYERVA
jgi:uncharacterized protein YaaQ